KAGTVLFKVTRPMTVPSLMLKKLQAPSSKLQGNSKHQLPKRFLPAPRPAIWSLGLGASLGFGAWNLELSYRYPRLSFIDDRRDHPAHRTFLITDHFACRHAIRRNHHPLVHPGALRIDGHLWHAFGSARLVDRLANDEPPSLQAR